MNKTIKSLIYITSMVFLLSSCRNSRRQTTITPTSSAEPSSTSVVTPSETPVISPSIEPTISVSPSETPVVSPTPSEPVTPTLEPSETPIVTPTVEPTVPVTPTPSETPIVTPTPSVEPTPTPSVIPTSEDILTIVNEGEYTLDKDYKQIYVNAPDKAVTINLNGHTIFNDENSPIYVVNCDSIDISANSNTTSYIYDARDALSSDDDSMGKGAIYVEEGDLTLKGKGTLYIDAKYNNGIHGKDDVKIKNLTLNIFALNDAIRGNDSVAIYSGKITISCGGDGIQTTNSDISSKGNQRGNITIKGGTIDINSWGDAISASYNTIIEELDGGENVNISAKTNEYSSYSGDSPDVDKTTLYLKLNSSTYSGGNYTYAAYINNEWYKASYKGTMSSQGGGPGGGGPGGGGTYYIYSLSRPVSATSFTLYRFAGSNVTEFSTSSYNAKSDAKAFNSAYDMVQISVSSSRISFGNWSNYSSSSRGADISAKGIKAENEIIINGGTINIEAYDDGIHANNDGTLENGSSPLGNITISSGDITVKAADDGIHADYTLSIEGGNINVTESYEGLEANLIRIKGGETYVFATDDGVNAYKGNSSPDITISGGFIDVTVSSSGDTDGIDSNGTFNQTGGVCIIKGPGSASSTSFGAAALDADGTIKITSGTLIVFGGIESTPSYSVTKTLCSSSTVSTGSHSVSFTSVSYTTVLKYSTRGCVVYSSLGSASLS